ncbi:MAG: RAMP superfamily CRISPR-associated protein [Cyanobacteriota bacterium]|nr:RAMP superfamily CRISPR-associated protein [Cyanobacteriota bacterium]
MTLVWLTCREPVHIGGADSSSRGNNNPIFRLPDRAPAIPGSSLRGALREDAQNNNEYEACVSDWFGKEGKEITPGKLAIGWGWPMWWPVHVLGYGTWWVSCLSWLTRARQLSPGLELPSRRDTVCATHPELGGQTVYLRWLKLKDVQHYSHPLPLPSDVPKDRCLIVPDETINLIVDMGLVRQPRVSLLDEPDKTGSLVDNLFSVEGLPPGAVFLTSWTKRGELTEEQQQKWPEFLHGEHYLGGLWSVGYGRIYLEKFGNG